MLSRLKVWWRGDKEVAETMAVLDRYVAYVIDARDRQWNDAIRRWWICARDMDRVEDMTAANAFLGILSILKHPEAGIVAENGLCGADVIEREEQS